MFASKGDKKLMRDEHINRFIKAPNGTGRGIFTTGVISVVI